MTISDQQTVLGISDKALRYITRFLVKPVLQPRLSFVQQRWRLNAASALLSWPRPWGITITQTYLGKVPCQKLTPLLSPAPETEESETKEPERIVLYFHGGAYCLGTSVMPIGMLARLSKAMGATVYIADYRLAPEHPFPAALDDATGCYQALLEQGKQASHISLMGDAAGGGLSLACALELEQQQLPQPESLVLLSPWCDTSLPFADKVDDRQDNILSWSWLAHCAAAYAKGEDVNSPRLSPLRANNLGSLPPILIQVGSEEIFLEEAKALHSALAKIDHPVQLDVFAGGWHAFQLNARLSPLARKALVRVSTFLKSRSPEQPPS